jgi:hypothetical protein
MQIVLELAWSRTRRPTGTARLAGQAHSLPFSGTLELLARIEELCVATPGTNPQGHAPAGELDDEPTRPDAPVGG